MTQRREPNTSSQRGPRSRTPAQRAPYRLRVALAAWIVAEAAAFIGLAYLIGIGYTLLIFIATSVLGAALIPYLGAKSFRAARDYLNSGGDPSRETPNGYAVAGAVCLFIPGFVTDLVGLLLLFPPSRLLFRGLGRYLAARTPPVQFGRGGGDIIDGEVLDERDAGAQPGPEHDERPRRIE